MTKRKTLKGTDGNEQADTVGGVVEPKYIRTLYVGLWLLPACPEFIVTADDIKTVMACLETDDLGAIETVTFIRWTQCTRVFHVLPNRDTGLARRWREVKDIVVSELPDDLRSSLLTTGFSHEEFVTAYLDTPDPQGGTTARKALYLTPKWEVWALDNGFHPTSPRRGPSAGEESAGVGVNRHKQANTQLMGRPGKKPGQSDLVKKLRAKLYDARKRAEKKTGKYTAEPWEIWILKFKKGLRPKSLLEVDIRLQHPYKGTIKADALDVEGWKRLYKQEYEYRKKG